jgi:hypothetical protein
MMREEDMSFKLKWAIKNVLYLDNCHQPLLNFFQRAQHWLILNSTDSELKVISFLYKLLQNIELVLIFIKLEADLIHNQIDRLDEETFAFPILFTNTKETISVQAKWCFNLYTQEDAKKCAFLYFDDELIAKFSYEKG